MVDCTAFVLDLKSISNSNTIFMTAPSPICPLRIRLLHVSFFYPSNILQVSPVTLQTSYALLPCPVSQPLQRPFEFPWDLADSKLSSKVQRRGLERVSHH